MAEGRRQDLWKHTSHLLAALHNWRPGMKRGDMKPASAFDPTAPAEEPIRVPMKLFTAALAEAKHCG